jgi:hypothetical protein
MTFNAYITLDGCQYVTSAKTWHYEPLIPATERLNLDGTHDVTYGPGTYRVWIGEIGAPPTAVGSFGSIVDLRTSLAKRQLLSFTDHYGQNYPACLVLGPFKERPLSPDWNSVGSMIYVSVRISTV